MRNPIVYDSYFCLFPIEGCHDIEKAACVCFRKLLIPSPAEKITIKYLHLSTHNKRKIIINKGTLARLEPIFPEVPVRRFFLMKGMPEGVKPFIPVNIRPIPSIIRIARSLLSG